MEARGRVPLRTGKTPVWAARHPGGGRAPARQNSHWSGCLMLPRHRKSEVSNFNPYIWSLVCRRCGATRSSCSGIGCSGS